MREWWHDGCPSALTVRTWLLGLPAGLGFAAIFVLSRSAAPVVAGVLFVAAGYVAAGTIILLARPVIERRPATTRAWLTLLCLAAVGPIAALVARGASSMAGFPPQGAPPATLPAIAVVCGVWLTVAALISYWLDADAGMRRRLLRELARERALAIDSSRYLEADRQQLTTEVQETLTQRLGAVGADGATEVAPDLEDLIATVIRPLSHGLHDEAVEESALVQELQDLDVPTARPLREYVTRVRTVHTGDIILLGALVVTGLAASVPALRAGVSTAGLAVALLIVLASAAALGWLLIGTRARAESSRADLTKALDAAEWASARLRQSAWVARRELANRLHGNVQARVLAAALQLRQDQAGDPAEILTALETEVDDLLRGRHAETDWRVGWDRLIHIWGFSIDLRAELADGVPDALDEDSVAGQSLVAVLGEAVTNAVRHGDARTVEIRVDRHGEDEILVAVTDDGDVDAGSGDQGLGTLTFEAACVAWDLTPSETGHRMTARIPLLAAGEKTEAEVSLR